MAPRHRGQNSSARYRAQRHLKRAFARHRDGEVLAEPTAGTFNATRIGAEASSGFEIIG
jgi:hypothetical protein